ncbi:MAG TPA: TauD/TfdA family dioxygenase [Stellaceae bacterium]|nr:TauD/TfdA family dioxygenase [Stellaceae bacterium]
MSFEIRPLSPIVAAEIVGLDLSRTLDDADFATVRRAFDEHSVLVFRDQDRLTPEQHIAFSRRFGPLEVHVQARFLLRGHPEILIVSNVFENGQPIGLVDAGHYWHSDLSYLAEPSLGSMLHAQELPAEGGDTLFVGMHAAYDALDDATKARIAPLEAEHSYLARNQKQVEHNPHRPQLDQQAAARVPPVVHPMVRVHPGSGRPTLFVNEGFTTRVVGLPEDESRALLARLFAHMTEPRFIYRHRWQAHDLVFWDNRATVHLATGCPPHLRRRLYRTTVRGDRPIAPAHH